MRLRCSSVALVDLDRENTAGVACVASGASYKALLSITPGQLVTIFGRGLGPERLAAFENGQPLPSIVDGTEVLFNGMRAPFLAALSSQLNVVAPFGLEGRITLEIRRSGERIYWRQFQSLGSNPDPLLRVSAEGTLTQWPDRQFTVLLADAINEDGSSNSAGNPAVPGSAVTVFVTGLGEYDAPVSATDYGDGKTRPANRYIVRTSSERADEANAVTVPGRTVGVTAVRLRVPDNARRVLRFWIDPPNSTPNFAPTNFIYVRESY